MKIDKGIICDDFLTRNRRQYVIPVYQRNYEWSKEQCTKLFRDIVEAGKRGRKHFCGSVVYASLKNTNDIDYEIEHSDFVYSARVNKTMHEKEEVDG